ncbi:MAG TPA: hypothetical protein VD867_18795 [Burkholderiales bacterium]|nr:hypothetical protein [Burkholderiales bacterium]
MADEPLPPVPEVAALEPPVADDPVDELLLPIDEEPPFFSPFGMPPGVAAGEEPPGGSDSVAVVDRPLLAESAAFAPATAIDIQPATNTIIIFFICDLPI